MNPQHPDTAQAPAQGSVPGLLLRIVTPLETVVTESGLQSLTAEDASGRFGIRPRHAAFLTVLALSVCSWRRADGSLCHAALRGGLLRVSGGQRVDIATREAVLGTDLNLLSGQVLARFRETSEAERVEHVDQTRLQLAAIRELASRIGSAPGGKAAG